MLKLIVSTSGAGSFVPEVAGASVPTQRHLGRDPRALIGTVARPFFFGPQDRLFGIYEPPQIDAGHSASVVLCYPYGQDYRYAHRPFRTLAIRLARAGFHVLRFDYCGTGDSAGDDAEISISQWKADVKAAIDQVRWTQDTPVSVVGMGLGATLASTAAAECGSVARLVLWDPVTDGSDYLLRLQECHRGWFESLARGLPLSRQAHTDDDLLGLRCTWRFRHELKRLNLISLATKPAREVLIVTSDDNPHAELAGQLSAVGSTVTVKPVADVKMSSMLPGMPLAIVPNRILTTIEGWLRERLHD